MALEINLYALAELLLSSWMAERMSTHRILRSGAGVQQMKRKRQVTDCNSIQTIAPISSLARWLT